MFEAEIEIICVTNKGREIPFIYETEVECAYSTRVEECYGYHTFFEVDERDYERQCEIAKDDFIANTPLELITNDLIEELEEDETIIEMR